MEMERVPAAGFPIKGLPVAGFDRKRLWRNFGVLIKLLRSMLRARRIIRDFKPQLAIGVGGYASGPVLKAAQRAGIPTLIQEQNSYAGVTNKLLSARAGVICTAYDNMERFFPAGNIIKTGNPVREALLHVTMSQAEAKAALGFDPSLPLVLVVGGSLGARTINESMAAALDKLLADGKTQILWQTGRTGEQIGIDATEGREGVKATPFIADMATAYRAADLVVSRAGAGTISELQLLGKAAILVPSPNVAEDHQRKNALALVDCDAAVMVTDADAPQKLAGEIERLLSDSALRDRLSGNILKMAMREADERIVDAAEALIIKSQSTK